MRLTVTGTGHPGATHAACTAEPGHEVPGVDTRAARPAPGRPAPAGEGE